MKRWHLESMLRGWRAKSDPLATVLVAISIGIVMVSFGLWMGTAR